MENKNKLKTIMILGAGVMQLPAIKLAKSQGWRVIAADGNTKAPGIGLADQFLPIDLKDKEALTAAGAKIKAEQGLDGVFTAGTDFSAVVAHIAEALDLPGIPYAAALRASDKGLMRQAFKDAGVPSPGFLLFRKGDDPLTALKTLNLPLVAKPVDNMGARGIQRINIPQDLNRGFAEALVHSRSGSVILEEYIPGPEFSLDALVEDGKITICGMADRHIFYPPYFIEMGHTIPTNQPSHVVEAVEEVFKKGIKALGITRGAAKGDIKLSPSGPVVGEIAARLSGGFMSGWTFPYASGLEPTLGAMRLALGMSGGDLTQDKGYFSAERAFISIHGEVSAVEDFEKATDLEGIESHFLKVVPGDRVDFPRNNVEKCGNFISQSPDRTVAMDTAAQAAAIPFIRLKTGDEHTENFLNRTSHNWVPDAFEINDEKNLQYLKGLTETGWSSSVIPQLPQDEDGKDWQGRTLITALEEVSRLTRRPLGVEGQSSPGEKRFWDAFLRGGIQGAVWLIDSLGVTK